MFSVLVPLFSVLEVTENWCYTTARVKRGDDITCAE